MEAVVIALGASFILNRDSWLGCYRGAALFAAGMACGFIVFGR